MAVGDRIAEQQTFEVTLDNVGTITAGAEISIYRHHHRRFKLAISVSHHYFNSQRP